jgi:uroporphyrinogen decarboxylase
MTPRERVRAALVHQPPDRVPFAWNFGPTPEMARVLTRYLAGQGLSWPALRDAVDDVRNIAPVYIGPAMAYEPGKDDLGDEKGTPVVDIWGIVRRAQSYGAGAYDEIAVYPLAGVEDPAVLDDYPWPDPTAYDYAGFRARVLASDGAPARSRARKLAISFCGNPFEIYCWMTGLEEALVNVLLNPDLVRTALAQITRVFAAKMELALAEVGDLVDILYFADDLGGQRNLLMSRRAYRDVLKPYHARLFGLGKELAPQAAVMFHSDGAVFDILPDLIDAGVDVLEAVQTDAAGMDPARLKAAYGDRLAFHGGIPVQSLLPHEDTETVYAACRDLVAVFGEGGGYIAAPTHAIQVGTPPGNVMAMLRAVLGETDYAKALAAAKVD